mmetsp:Transcript_25955/g.47557  ORF Transcript_25955/g.47557 Transcript_25955/m.47557 type:complete len:88 (+) Transcript_25955:740-1003(+)
MRWTIAIAPLIFMRGRCIRTGLSFGRGNFTEAVACFIHRIVDIQSLFFRAVHDLWIFVAVADSPMCQCNLMWPTLTAKLEPGSFFFV